jgi:DNA (cytosine-5)-methyltransferase 1
VPDFYEFFAGGGMARAGLSTGWECLFANDFDHKKCTVYRRNRRGGADLQRRNPEAGDGDDKRKPRRACPRLGGAYPEGS